MNDEQDEPVAKLRAMLDEMLPPVIAKRLTAAGHDVVAVKAIPELIGESDEALLVRSTAERRILVTLDLADFAEIDVAWKATARPHAGLLYVSTATFPPGGRFAGATIRALAHAAETGRLPVSDGSMFLGRVSGD